MNGGKAAAAWADGSVVVRVDGGAAVIPGLGHPGETRTLGQRDRGHHITVAH